MPTRGNDQRMTASFRIGRIAGIPIGANWSWLIVFGLVLWSLAVNVFPDQDNGLSNGAYWGMAAIAAILFFGSILLHELGHALQARREGVEIEGITLWLFGGVARFRGTFPSAGAEFRIAVAGPVVSAAIAGALLLFAAFTSLPESVDGVAFWVGYINAVVLAFNLIPALPLDGGRILHSGLWRWTRDLVRATEVGAGIGRGFGWLMIGGGIASILFGGGIGGVWLIFVGWFLSIAAQAEAAQVIARERLGGRRVGDLMVEHPVSVEPDLTVGELMDEVAHHHHHSTYPVVENGRAIGLVPFRCIAQTPRAEWDERHIRDCMLLREQVPTVAEDDEAGEAFQRLAESGAGRALVIDDGRLVGLLTMADLVRAARMNGRR
jgi:Zn-dependent protease/predicted transcriptional regulator